MTKVFPARSRNPAGILNDDWFRILRMDGFQCQVPPDDPATVYAEGQYGRLYRVDVAQRRSPLLIKPRPPRPDTPAYRFNWSAPLVQSAHEAKTLYYGGNYVFKTTDQGMTWRIISHDLTSGLPGESPHTGQVGSRRTATSSKEPARAS